MAVRTRWRLIVAIVIVCAGAAIYLATKWAERESRLAPFSKKELATGAHKMYGSQTNLRVLAPISIEPSRKLRLAVGGFGLVDPEQSARLSDLVTPELSS